MMLSLNAYSDEGAPTNELSFQELEIIIGHLEIGTVVTKFFKNKQPDKRNLLFKRESRQIVWYKEMSKRNVYEGISKRIFQFFLIYAATLHLSRQTYKTTKPTKPSFLLTVDLRQVKEIRTGKSSRDFERWNNLPEYAKFEDNRCLAVFYGHEFRLKTLSICGRLLVFKINQLLYFLLLLNSQFISVNSHFEAGMRPMDRRTALPDPRHLQHNLLPSAAGTLDMEGILQHDSRQDHRHSKRCQSLSATHQLSNSQNSFERSFP